MVIQEYDYKTIYTGPPKFTPRTPQPYIPHYYMLFYNHPDSFYDYRAIKVRSDIVIDELWQPAVRSVLPEKIQQTDGKDVFIFDVLRLGGVMNIPIGYLGITSQDLTFRIIDLRTVMPSGKLYNAQTQMQGWLESDNPKYILVDYTEEELFRAMHKGICAYNDTWKGHEGRKNNPHIWEDLVKYGKD